MYKIAITGKANTGKNTLSAVIIDILQELDRKSLRAGHEIIAFADPIKEMIRQMFPQLPRKYLYGSSKYRGEIVPGAFRNGKPQTVRDLLIHLGTEVGRAYNPNVWTEAFDFRLQKAIKKELGVVIVTDVRFRNEFDHLKELGFYQIRLLRDSHLNLNHASETNQDSIKDEEFDYVLHNNSTLEALTNEVKTNIIPQLRVK
jgi:hypothetical protein